MEENVYGVLKDMESFTEEEYGNSNCMSYSLFKDIYDHPELLSAPKEDKKDEWLVFGTVVDILLTGDPDSIVVNKFIPTDLYKKICDYIIDNNLNISNLTDDQVVECFNYAESNVNWGIPVKKQKIIDNCTEYISLIVNNKDKVVVSLDLYNEASQLANTLLTHKWTKHLFLSKAEQKAKNIEIFYQYKIKYEYCEIIFKSKLDVMIVDHNTKTISIYDIKTGSDYPRVFLREAVYRYKYLYQACLYRLGAENFFSKINQFKDYTIDDFKFVYMSRVDPRFPVILIIDETLQSSFELVGLVNNRYFLPSVKEIVYALKYYLNKIETGESVIEPVDLDKSNGEVVLEDDLYNKVDEFFLNYMS